MQNNSESTQDSGQESRQESIGKFASKLGVDVSATPTEIRQAYIKLKRIYGDRSAGYSLVSDEQRLQQLEQLEFAYSGLSEWAQNRQDGTLTLGLSSADVRREMQKPRTHAGVQVALETTDQMRERIQKAEADNGFGTGALLAAMREAHGLDIDDVQKSLKISKEFVVAFEQEDFSRFPAPIYAKGFLKNLLRHLSYDRSEDFANHYLEMYKEWRTNQKSQRTSKSLSSKIAV